MNFRTKFLHNNTTRSVVSILGIIILVIGIYFEKYYSEKIQLRIGFYCINLAILFSFLMYYSKVFGIIGGFFAKINTILDSLFDGFSLVAIIFLFLLVSMVFLPHLITIMYYVIIGIYGLFLLLHLISAIKTKK